MAREQEEQRLQELGDFLRTRRNRIAPEDVGLPRGSRRRAPGLRRAEVAGLAGVSVDWYTWLEQGRPITVSTQVLESLVQALRLNADERAHLFFLAHQQPPPARAMEPETVSPALQLFLDHQGLSPAFVTGRRWDVVAWNEAARVVFGDYEQMTAHERNVVWRMFTGVCSGAWVLSLRCDRELMGIHVLTLAFVVVRHATDGKLPEDSATGERDTDLQEAGVLDRTRRASR